MTPAEVLILINQKYTHHTQQNGRDSEIPLGILMWRTVKQYVFPYMAAPRKFLKNCIAQGNDIDMFQNFSFFVSLIDTFKPVFLRETCQHSDPFYISDYTATRYVLNDLLKAQYSALHPNFSIENCLNADVLSELQACGRLSIDSLEILLSSARARVEALEILSQTTEYSEISDNGCNPL